MKYLIKNVLVFFLLLIPVFSVFAAPIIPCGGHVLDPNTGSIISEQPPCDFSYLLKLVDNIINWIILISVPVAAGVFAWAGFTYMTTGISDQKSYAKSMLWKVFWGFAAILAAWIIVGTILDALLAPAIRGTIKI
jgi:hypothetical protein